jgi:undecaprenyl-diphosphatase
MSKVHQGATWLSEIRAQVGALDTAVSATVDRTPTPTLDRFLVRLSNAANSSRIWLVTAGVVAVVGGPRGRRAAIDAVASIALASSVSNLAIKSVAGRRRPDVAPDGQMLASRQVRRPTTPSFPSGHTASAFAFASTMGEEAPPTWAPLHATAALIGYSRVHTGVHYPSDVMVGALIGAMCGWTVRRITGRIAGPLPGR